MEMNCERKKMCLSIKVGTYINHKFYGRRLKVTTKRKKREDMIIQKEEK